MDGIANVARQQQTQINSAESHGRVADSAQKVQQNLVKEVQEQSLAKNIKLNSKEDVESLVEKLNDALSPMNTSLKFGVDQDDIFYVSVIEQKTNEMIRRFPAEKAADFLPKMQEVTGILFDSKG